MLFRSILLQIFDDGRLTDGQGRTIDFKNATIILTSNIGAQMIFEDDGKDLEKLKEKLNPLLHKYFKPEFINRLDEIILFQKLDKLQIRKIVKLNLQKLATRLLDKRIKIKFTDNCIDRIAEQGFDPSFGARPLNRVIQREIENRLATKIIAGEILPNNEITVDYLNNNFTFTN